MEIRIPWSHKVILALLLAVAILAASIAQHTPVQGASCTSTTANKTTAGHTLQYCDEVNTQPWEINEVHERSSLPGF